MLCLFFWGRAGGVGVCGMSREWGLLVVFSVFGLFYRMLVFGVDGCFVRLSSD